MKIFTILFLIVFFAFWFGGGLNSSSYQLSRLEIDKNATRQAYYGPALGKIYENRVGVFYFGKIFPKQIKAESVFFNVLNKVWIFLPLYLILVYLGYKKSL